MRLWTAVRIMIPVWHNRLVDLTSCEGVQNKNIYYLLSPPQKSILSLLRWIVGVGVPAVLSVFVSVTVILTCRVGESKVELLEDTNN